MAALTIALAQLASQPGNIRANLALAAETVRCSTADVIAFPELYACGYDPAAIAKDPSWSITKDALGELCSAAAASATWVFMGASLGTAHSPLNAILIVDAEGNYRGHYAKRHLWRDEANCFAPGADLVLLEIAGYKLGLGICYDAGFPEFCRSYALAGTDAIIFCSAFAIGHTEYRYQIYHPVRALENTNYVLVANSVGEIAGERYFGRSAAYSPDGKPIHSSGEQPGIFTVPIDAEDITRARKELPYLTDLRTGETHVTRLR